MIGFMKLFKIIRLSIIFVFFLLFTNSYSQTETQAQTKTQVQKGKRPSVGLVMSGGGAKGFAYIGLLKVIQEAGLRVDYVAGTSMGSIVAGFYAIGYHPDSIYKIVREQNWDMVINDQIPREDVAFEEKEFGEKYIVSLPFRKKKLSMMSSIHEGQEVDRMLNYYLSPVYNVDDFSDLQIPFLCIGTDLLTGEQVELKTGYLPDAIRASMSIPGYFSPMEIDGKYLVDGGVVNNYPVLNVKNEGIDIIVGADVQFGLKDDINDLQSITSVIDQIVGFSRVDANTEGYANTDLYIHIPLDYGTMDFTSYDSIIAIGESIGRQHFDEIKALADSLNAIEYRPLREFITQPLESVYVDDVLVEGNVKMPDVYFRDLVIDYSNKDVSLKELEDRVTMIYGTKFFKHISYKFRKNGDKNNLVFVITESDPGYLSAAVHYDLNYQGSILANMTARNVLGKRSKLFVDLVLGTNPRLKAMYSLNNSKGTGLGVITDIYTFKFNDYQDGVKSGRLEFSNYSVQAFVHKSYSNKVKLRAGLLYEYFKFKEDVVTDTSLLKYSDFSSYGTLFASFNVDTRDHPYYPTKGVQAELKFKYMMPWSNNTIEELVQSAAIVYLKYDHNIKLAPKFVLRPGFFGAATFKHDKLPPIQHWVGVGGLNPNNYVETHVSFTGVNFVQSWGFYTWIVRMKLQYELMDKIYLIARADVGINANVFEQLNNMDNTMFGYGLTASYNSFIGPVEFTIMGSNINPDPTFFVNIGFWL